MINPLPNLFRTLQAGLIALALPAVAQVPNTLLHSIPEPPGGVQSTDDNFGSSVALSGTRLVVGAFRDDTGGTDAGRVYVFDLIGATPTGPVLAINNPYPPPPGYSLYGFGTSLAVSSNRLVVGAFAQDQTRGAAFVYDLGGATPDVPTIVLQRPTPTVGDFFGETVAMSGPLVIAGCWGEDTGASNAGAAYVFDVGGSTPTVPLYVLPNPEPATGDQFGVSVAISGSLAVVGANSDDTGAANAGSAYVYDLAGATPTVPLLKLANPSPDVSDVFGGAVAIEGRWVVIGARADDGGAIDAGTAYVYDLNSPTSALPVLTLHNPEPAAGDAFGRRVAISGTRIVVGAASDDACANDSGSAYIYELTSSTPSVPVVSVNNPTPSTSDSFGTSVAIDSTIVAIGASGDDTTGLNQGASYIYGPHPLDQDSDGLLDSWEIAQFSTTTGHGALDDSDHDGYCELLELGFGMNPTLPSAGGLPPAIDEGGFLAMTITKQTGVTYEVQSAGSLLPAMPDSFSPSTTTVITNNPTTLKVRDNFLISAAPGRFMRVKVTAAP